MTIVTTRALAAAERVRESCTVRTHIRPDQPGISPKTGRALHNAARVNRERITEMRRKGMQNAEIAVALSLSESRVAHYVTELLEAGKIKRIPNGAPRSRAVRVDGKHYSSVTLAKMALNVSSHQLYEWLRSGRATYV